MRNLFLLLTLLGVTASCTNEQDVTLTQGGQPGEIQIMFNGNGAQTDYPTTRAIAIDTENQIDNLDVFIFASDKENGVYYFVEQWSKGDSDDTATKKFALQGSGANRKASIFPTEYKGYPYLKLYCVANSNKIYDADNADGVTLKPLEVKADGTIDNTKASKSTDIEKCYLASITDTPIATPLPMAGVVSTLISSDYSLVTVEMIRRVARFDVVNDAATTNLTITKITPLNARPTYTLFKEEYTGTLKDKYPEIDFTTRQNANNGITPAAFYVFPTSKTDEMELLIEGTYSGAPVKYYVKVAFTPEPTVAVPTPVAAYIDVKTNNRYTLRIKDVREAGLSVMFDIEDWTLGGGVITKPDNNIKPEILEVKNDATTPAYGEQIDDTIKIDKAGKFSITGKANGKLQAFISPVKPYTQNSWIATNNLEADKTIKFTPDGMIQTTMTFTTVNITTAANSGGQAYITIINSAASKDPALQKVFVAKLPEVIPPTIEWNTTKYPANDYKTKIDNTDPTNPVIYWYKVSGNNNVYLSITAPYDMGTTITKVGNIGSFTLPTYSANTKIMTVSTPSMAPTLATTDGDFIIRNLVDATKETTVHIKYIDAKTLTPTVTDPNVELAGTTCTIDVDNMNDGANTFDLTIDSSEGETINTSALPAWISIAEKEPFNKENENTVYTVTVTKDSDPAATYGNGSCVFTQAIKNAANLTLTFKKKETTPAP